MKSCVFCKIVEGKLPCYKVYEDSHFLAFLDIKPLNPGHCLVIPKKHYKDLFDIPESELAKLSLIFKKILAALKAAKLGSGWTLLQANGKAAGQFVEHLHFHVVPRKHKDGTLKLRWAKKPSKTEMEAIASRLRKKLKL